MLKVSLEYLSGKRTQQKSHLKTLIQRLFLYEAYKTFKALRRRILLFKDFQMFTLRYTKSRKRGFLDQLHLTHTPLKQMHARDKLQGMLLADLDNKRQQFIQVFQKRIFRLNSYKLLK